jgi:hypothetical protein
MLFLAENLFLFFVAGNFRNKFEEKYYGSFHGKEDSKCKT